MFKFLREIYRKLFYIEMAMMGLFILIGSGVVVYLIVQDRLDQALPILGRVAAALLVGGFFIWIVIDAPNAAKKIRQRRSGNTDSSKES